MAESKMAVQESEVFRVQIFIFGLCKTRPLPIHQVNETVK